jgi:hypothetical protein
MLVTLTRDQVTRTLFPSTNKLALLQPVSLSNSQFTMTFALTYAQVLAPFVSQFKDASNDKIRTSVVNIACDAVKRSKNLLEDAEELPADLRTVSISPLLA